MPNDVRISEAALTLVCENSIIKTRSDMSFDEYTAYKNDWAIFNRVWAYNYTVRALRAGGGGQSYYQFLSDSERLSYIRGQTAHVYMYPAAALLGKFNNIP